MTEMVFLDYFKARLELVKDDLTPAQYEELADLNCSKQEMRTKLIDFIEVEGYTEELDWLVSLTRSSSRTVLMMSPIRKMNMPS